MFVEAVPWIARTGSPWRDLPPEFEPSNSVYQRFARWPRADIWQAALTRLAGDADLEERGGQTGDSPEALCCGPQLNPASLAADKAYDTNATPQHLESEGINAVIPSRANRRVSISYDKLSERFL